MAFCDSKLYCETILSPSDKDRGKQRDRDKERSKDEERCNEKRGGRCERLKKEDGRKRLDWMPGSFSFYWFQAGKILPWDADCWNCHHWNAPLTRVWLSFLSLIHTTWYNLWCPAASTPHMHHLKPPSTLDNAYTHFLPLCVKKVV